MPWGGSWSCAIVFGIIAIDGEVVAGDGGVGGEVGVWRRRTGSGGVGDVGDI